MTKNHSFHDYVVHDLLKDLPDITSRPMFGGWAIYKENIIFALIVLDELYFKINDGNRADFEAMDSHPFTYSKDNGKVVKMPYWLVPERVMEDKERLYEFVEKFFS